MNGSIYICFLVLCMSMQAKEYWCGPALERAFCTQCCAMHHWQEREDCTKWCFEGFK